MAKLLGVDRLKTDYPPAGFSIPGGWVAPFFGRDGYYVMVNHDDRLRYLTPQDARRIAAVLLNVLDALDSASGTNRTTEE